MKPSQSIDTSLQQFSVRVPENSNPFLKTIIERINQDEEVFALWKIANVNSIDRLGFSDHGPVHVQIVANSSLRILRILIKNNVEPSIVKDFHLTNHHAEAIVVTAGLLHDIGMSIHRASHEEFSLVLANPILHRLFDFFPIAERYIMISETLHTIISHRHAGHPFTIEANVVRVADALDMSSGRSRIPFSLGKVDIHSVSALAIEKVEISEGTTKPIEIDIFMNNSAGIFQVDELLKEKLVDSVIQQYIQVKAYIKHKTEKKLITEFSI